MMGAREKILHLMNQYLLYFDTGEFDKLAKLFEHGMVSKVGPLTVEGKL